MQEDLQKINFEDFQREGNEIPDFGFDRKREKIEMPGSPERKDATKEGLRKFPHEVSSGQMSVSGMQKSAGIQAIENILEEDLGDVYFSLTPDKQREFKRKGEETAVKISILTQKTKVKVKKIISLIRDWLLLIPGVNKFFLEQEAKIKTDKIIELKNK